MRLIAKTMKGKPQGSQMKIAIMCESELLQKSLEPYLKDYQTSLEKCDFVLSDYQACDMKPVCLVGNFSGAHIKKPFTPETLKANLRIFYERYCKGKQIASLSPKDAKTFAQIDALIQETLNDFRQKLYEILQANKESRK